MRKTEELWRFVLESLIRNETVILMIVGRSKGSSPGRPGFKLAVSKSGFTGSIGGGVMEVSLVEKAQALLKSDESIEQDVLDQIHRENSPQSSGMICSGEQTLLFRTIKPDAVPEIRSCISALKSGAAQELTITRDKILVGNDGGPKTPCLTVLANGDYVYTESLGTVNLLCIIGGGHCALALSELMSKLDFRIAVFDDRPGLDSLSKNSFADAIDIIDDYSAISRFVDSGENTYVVVMTLGYKYDKVVIRELAEKEFRYFGVLGSKAKMAALLRELANEGVSPEKLDRIHTPIGMEINSQTPEEIAVSIAAEIVLTKNKEHQ